MDTEVVNAIADKLGIAADKVASCLSDLIPQWAIKNVATNAVCMGASLLILLVSAIALTLVWRSYKRVKEDRDLAEEKLLWMILFAALIIIAFLFVVMFLNNVVSYAVAPEAMFAKDILKMVS